MVKLNKNDVLKIQILKQYNKKNISYTASYLSKLLNSKFETIKKALEFYYMIGVVEKEFKDHGTKKTTYYNITKIGMDISQKIKPVFEDQI